MEIVRDKPMLSSRGDAQQWGLFMHEIQSTTFLLYTSLMLQSINTDWDLDFQYEGGLLFSLMYWWKEDEIMQCLASTGDQRREGSHQAFTITEN